MTTKLEELLALAEKASAGPWEVDRDNYHVGNIATLHGEELGYAEVWTPSWATDGKRLQHTNAAFIAAARNAIPEIRLLMERLREAEDIVDRVQSRFPEKKLRALVHGYRMRFPKSPQEGDAT